MLRADDELDELAGAELALRAIGGGDDDRRRFLGCFHGASLLGFVVGVAGVGFVGLGLVRLGLVSRRSSAYRCQGRRPFGFGVELGGDLRHGRAVEGAERQERDFVNQAGGDVEDAVRVLARLLDRGADREGAARA